MSEKMPTRNPLERVTKSVSFENCPLVKDKTRDEIERDGWEYAYSWHQKDWKQVEDVADRVKQGQKSGDWEYIRVTGFTENERDDSVHYLFKRKTPQRVAWDKQQGYN
ncbi:hypothetical protein GF360_03090 [candidate division WWE3 bacterium]|nr:hypothetical protein [candidate division WWE3 bacterium]